VNSKIADNWFTDLFHLSSLNASSQLLYIRCGLSKRKLVRHSGDLVIRVSGLSFLMTRGTFLTGSSYGSVGEMLNEVDEWLLFLKKE
jgi:hypothetical protein